MFINFRRNKIIWKRVLSQSRRTQQHDCYHPLILWNTGLSDFQFQQKLLSFT